MARGISASVSLKGSFVKYAESMYPEIDKVILDTALDIASDAAALAPVDTGALSASHYVVTKNFSDYAEKVSAAMALKPEAKPLAEIMVTREHQAKVAASVEHWFYVHYGTVIQSSNPYLFEAVNLNRDAFEEDLRKAMVLRNPARR